MYETIMFILTYFKSDFRRGWEEAMRRRDWIILVLGIWIGICVAILALMVIWLVMEIV